MADGEEYLRYQQDATVLATIGAHLDPQISPINVRLPRSLAELAVAAWNREEPNDIAEASREQHELRSGAADLALMGLAISSRGVPDGEEVVVDLDVVQIAAALLAFAKAGLSS